MEIPNSIIFNGTEYRLMSNGKYYLSQSNTNEGRKNPKGLHVAIWEYYNGRKVPDGYCIHHIDHNTFNNDISNLECVEQGKHLSEHSKFNWSNPESRAKQLENLKNASEKAKEWHSSEAGIEWHKKHISESLSKAWAFREERECEYCHNKYIAKKSNQKYCSTKCQDLARNRREGIPDAHQNRICRECGTEFISNAIQQTFCCAKCRARFNARVWRQTHK